MSTLKIMDRMEVNHMGGSYNLDRFYKIFKAIKKNTKFCGGCGVPFNMDTSGHSHFPFCEKCRGRIIKKELGTVERSNPNTQISTTK